MTDHGDAPVVLGVEGVRVGDAVHHVVDPDHVDLARGGQLGEHRLETLVIYSRDTFVGSMGLPFSTYAKFSGFLTPSLPLVRISRNLSVLSYAKIGHIFDTPSPSVRTY